MSHRIFFDRETPAPQKPENIISLKAGRFSATTSSQQARAGRKTHADIVLDKKPALDLPPGSIWTWCTTFTTSAQTALLCFTRLRTSLSSSRDAVDLRVSGLNDVLPPPGGANFAPNTANILFTIPQSRHILEPSLGWYVTQRHNTAPSPALFSAKKHGRRILRVNSFQFSPFEGQFFAFFFFWGWILCFFHRLRMNSFQFSPFEGEFFAIFTLCGWFLCIFYSLRVNSLQLSIFEGEFFAIFSLWGWILFTFTLYGWILSIFYPLRVNSFAIFPFSWWILCNFQPLRVNSFHFYPSRVNSLHFLLFEGEFFAFFIFWGWILCIFYLLRVNSLYFSLLRVNSLQFSPFKGEFFSIFSFLRFFCGWKGRKITLLVVNSLKFLFLF